MKAILAVVVLAVALWVVPTVSGAPGGVNPIFESPAKFTEIGAEYLSGKTITSLDGSKIITFPIFEGPGNSQVQQLRKFLNDEGFTANPEVLEQFGIDPDRLLKDGVLRMNGLSPMAHLLQPEFVWPPA